MPWYAVFGDRWQAPPPAQGLWSAFIVSTAEALTWQWKVVECGWIMLNSTASRIYDRHQLAKDCEILHRWLLSEFVKSPSGWTGLKHAMPWTIWTISIHVLNFLNCRYCRHRSANKLFRGFPARLGCWGTTGFCALLRPGLPNHWHSWLTSGPQNFRLVLCGRMVVWLCLIHRTGAMTGADRLQRFSKEVVWSSMKRSYQAIHQ